MIGNVLDYVEPKEGSRSGCGIHHKQVYLKANGALHLAAARHITNCSAACLAGPAHIIKLSIPLGTCVTGAP